MFKGVHGLDLAHQNLLVDMLLQFLFQEYCLLGCDAMECGRCIPTLRRKLPLAFSE
jgi:hypothetical protein